MIANTGLVKRPDPRTFWCRLSSGPQFLQCLFRSWIGEVEPLLEEIVAQHALQVHWRPAVLALGTVGRDRGAKILPGHHFLYVGKKSLATGMLPVGLEGTGGYGKLGHAFSL